MAIAIARGSDGLVRIFRNGEPQSDPMHNCKDAQQVLVLRAQVLAEQMVKLRHELHETEQEWTEMREALEAEGIEPPLPSNLW